MSVGGFAIWSNCGRTVVPEYYDCKAHWPAESIARRNVLSAQG